MISSRQIQATLCLSTVIRVSRGGALLPNASTYAGFVGTTAVACLHIRILLLATAVGAVTVGFVGSLSLLLHSRHKSAVRAVSSHRVYGRTCCLLLEEAQSEQVASLPAAIFFPHWHKPWAFLVALRLASLRRHRRRSASEVLNTFLIL